MSALELQRPRWYLLSRLTGFGFAITLLILSLTACEPPRPEPAPPPEPVAPVAPRLAPHDAARQGAIDQLKLHAAQGVDLNLQDEFGATLLHEAASAGQADTVRWLVEQGADFEVRDESGFTPVQLASFMDHERVVNLLVEFGAELELFEAVDFDELLEPDVDDPVEVVDVEPEPELPEEWKDLEFSTWTSSAGQTVEAAFIEMQQDLVILGSRDGRISRVPITQLHRDDQIRARQLGMGDLSAMRTRGAAGVDPSFTRVTTGFSSECERMLIRAIQQAREEVLVAIYTLTRPQIQQALTAAAARGVRVRVKYDVGQAPVSRMQELLNSMETRGVEMIPISMSGRYASMHHKFIVVDRTQVFTGSFNFTVMAITQNYENCVLIESASVARDFAREFDRIRSR